MSSKNSSEIRDNRFIHARAKCLRFCIRSSIASVPHSVIIGLMSNSQRLLEYLWIQIQNCLGLDITELEPISHAQWCSIRSASKMRRMVKEFLVLLFQFSASLWIILLPYYTLSEVMGNLSTSVRHIIAIHIIVTIVTYYLLYSLGML